MSAPGQTVISPSASAVRVTGVTKTFEQWQRSGKAKNIIRNLIKPEKRVVTALDDVSFTVEPGEFAAYAGPNGAGKSTTMKLLAGMLQPIQGEISVTGLSPQKDRIALMRRMGVLFGNRTELWFDHPVLQSFEWKRVVWEIPQDRYDTMLDMVTELLDLKDILHTFARELSLGQRMKADLAMMLLHEPELILLDEPTIGLDVLAKRQMIRFLMELNKEKKTTILVTSHDMDDLEEMARRILLISKGKIAYDGGFDGLRGGAGGRSRVRLTFNREGRRELAGTVLLSCEGPVCEYEFNQAEQPVAAVLREVSSLDGVVDVEIRKPPIEEVIAGLYTQWREGAV